MPQTEVVFYAETDGNCPLLAWLDRLPRKVQDKCIVRIERLAELGHELRRPEADTLRNGIHEIRASYQGVQYRILYFFHAGTAVLTHGIVKESHVQDVEIERARGRKAAYESDPERHTYQE
ncbi:MAG TPA: type II toxin-antitoxin system RelE/ParE family toxin [Thermoanaerobaculia bacterium]|nr:type II toxin-antitoxin system RelE/ParE family toxin [Thermoanaerobaculia bacterium]